MDLVCIYVTGTSRFEMCYLYNNGHCNARVFLTRFHLNMRGAVDHHLDKIGAILRTDGSASVYYKDNSSFDYWWQLWGALVTV